jgi:hypothetical protein
LLNALRRHPEGAGGIKVGPRANPCPESSVSNLGPDWHPRWRSMDAMSTVARRRIHLTETPRLAAIIERNAVPGEPRSATVARLVERADALSQEPELMVFHGTPGRAVTLEDVNDLLANEDAARYRDVTGG